MKVLLADDDADQLELRCSLLQRSGFETIAATSEVQALRYATAEAPECAVVDLRFPTVEAGLRLIRALKELNAAIHVFVLTGYDAARLDRFPEKDLVSAVITKGSGSSANLIQLLTALIRCGEEKLRDRLRTEQSLLLDVKVFPRSSRSEVVEARSDGWMKIKLAAVPENGKANEELIQLVAEFFHVRKDQVQIVSGEASQRKRLRIRT
jgi:uncharacterized protein (TIGR00251 family)